MQSYRYETLDFWRGIACILVILSHSESYAEGVAQRTEWADWALRAMSTGWVGVPLFFVVSGYCISVAVHTTRNRHNSSLRTYFFRRLKRIFPPYWVMLFGSAFAIGIIELAVLPGLFTDDTHAIPRPWWLTPWQWVGNATLTESWRPFIVGTDTGYFLGHAWTLCYEEQFYLIAGMTLLLPRRWFAISLGIVSVVSVALFLNGSGLRGTFLDGRWLQFFLGVLVFLFVTADNTVKRLIPLTLCGAAITIPVIDSSRIATGIAVAGGFSILLCVLWPIDRKVIACQWIAPISACGAMCYSLYLVHWPVCKATSHLLYIAGLRSAEATVVVTVPICVMMSVAVAIPFHLLIERRFLNSGPEYHWAFLTRWRDRFGSAGRVRTQVDPSQQVVM